MITILSVGHSRHAIGHFVALLVRAEVEQVVDVRSLPRSRFSPHFNRSALERTLEAGGIRYVFMGDRLGGRPPEAEFYDADGRVRYDLLAASPRFADGLAHVMDRAVSSRVAMLCSEEDPVHCHRRLLIGRVLAERGVTLSHLRGDGTVEEEAAVVAREGASSPPTLFAEASSWRSARPVARGALDRLIKRPLK